MHSGNIQDDERCNQPPIEREPLTITELAIELACAIYGVTIFVALLALVGSR